MVSSRKLPIISALLLGLIFIIPFQNCGHRSGDAIIDVEVALSSERGCGPQGFAILHENYFVPHCATCHDAGGLSRPPFAEPTDVEASMFWAKTVSKQSMLDSSTDNKFCGPNCNLDKSSQLYRILVEWLDRPTKCD